MVLLVVGKVQQLIADAEAAGFTIEVTRRGTGCIESNTSWVSIFKSRTYRTKRHIYVGVTFMICSGVFQRQAYRLDVDLAQTTNIPTLKAIRSILFGGR